MFNETDDGIISFVGVVDPKTNEEILLKEIKQTMSTYAILNIVIAYKANCARVYF